MQWRHRPRRSSRQLWRGAAELSAAQVETKVGPLRKHMLAETNTVQPRRFTDLLSASWGGFHDNSSGIGEVVLSSVSQHLHASLGGPLR